MFKQHLKNFWVRLFREESTTIDLFVFYLFGGFIFTGNYLNGALFFAFYLFVILPIAIKFQQKYWIHTPPERKEEE